MLIGGGPQLLGCYDDSTVGAYGLLPSPQPQLHDRVTLEACAAACASHALTVAGIDAGNHCTCGDATDLLPSKNLIRPGAECQATPCHADPAETGCGGPSRTVTYTFTCTPQPPGPPTPRPSPPPPPPPPPPGGSAGGAFGRWLSDPAADGMPAFVYELDQTSRSGSVTASTYYRAAGQTPASWGRAPADNLFQFGIALRLSTLLRPVLPVLPAHLPVLPAQYGNACSFSRCGGRAV